LTPALEGSNPSSSAKKTPAIIMIAGVFDFRKVGLQNDFSVYLVFVESMN